MAGLFASLTWCVVVEEHWGKVGIELGQWTDDLDYPQASFLEALAV